MSSYRLDKHVMRIAEDASDFAEVKSALWRYHTVTMSVHRSTIPIRTTVPFCSIHQIHLELTRTSGCRNSYRYNSVNMWRRFHSATGNAISTWLMYQDQTRYREVNNEKICSNICWLDSIYVFISPCIYLLQCWKRKVMASHIQYAGAN
jgi:hypothetical protein